MSHVSFQIKASDSSAENNVAYDNTFILLTFPKLFLGSSMRG